MTKCQRCNGTKRMTYVAAKCRDQCFTQAATTESEGYVPDWIGPGGYGDYVCFHVCRHCGQMQGDWPADYDSADPRRFKWGRAR